MSFNNPLSHQLRNLDFVSVSGPIQARQSRAWPEPNRTRKARARLTTLNHVNKVLVVVLIVLTRSFRVCFAVRRVDWVGTRSNQSSKNATLCQLAKTSTPKCKANLEHEL